MDFAYDLINDRSSTPKPSDTTGSDSEATSSTPTRATQQPQRQDLQTEFQETFKAFSNTQWGAKLGGWWSTTRTQGASYYESARKEAEKREAEAARVLEEARKLVVERTKTVVEAAENQLDNIVNEEKRAELQAARKQQREHESERSLPGASTIEQQEEEDTDTFLARFKSEAAKRLKEVQKAEDAADEALLRFGTNIRNFLKDTISVSAPEASSQSQSTDVVFESRDIATGKRVIHTSRFDAQLHVIHTTPSSFTEDPEASQGWQDFKEGFDIADKTHDIATDLDKYSELRSTMETLVPETIDYKDFWTRYYFLRHVVQSQEEKRKELLQSKSNAVLGKRIFTDKVIASTVDQEEVAWDEDSETEAGEREAEQVPTTTDASQMKPSAHARTDSDAITLRAPRRSHDEKSVADSEASYDLVSGAASHANSSPKEKHIKEEESDDDWE